MHVEKAIQNRRSYRALAPLNVTPLLLKDLATSAQLSASCFNNQPWNFIFIHQESQLKQMHQALSQGNEWAQRASLIIAVYAKKEDDCVIHDREYYLFDTGLATAQLILRATELGLVCHPIAGYSPKKTREILHIPEEYQVITLLIIGKHATKETPEMSDKQREAEPKRPPRKPLSAFCQENMFEQPLEDIKA